MALTLLSLNVLGQTSQDSFLYLFKEPSQFQLKTQMCSNNDDINGLNVKAVQGITVKISQSIVRPPLAASSICLLDFVA